MFCCRRNALQEELKANGAFFMTLNNRGDDGTAPPTFTLKTWCFKGGLHVSFVFLFFLVPIPFHVIFLCVCRASMMMMV